MNKYKNIEQNKKKELYELISKCSPKELDLISKIIKTVLPYIGY